MFNIGDKVKCIKKSHDIKKYASDLNKIYTVIKIGSENSKYDLYLHNEKEPVDYARFELYEQEVTPPAVKKTAAEEWGF